MAGVYVFSEKNDLAAELISFAQKTGEGAYVISFSTEQAEKLKAYGADRIYVMQGSSPMMENYAAAVADFLSKQEAALFLVGATPTGRDIAARVAGYLDCGMTSDILSLNYVDGSIITRRMMYGGAVVQSETMQSPGVVTVPAGKFEAAAESTAQNPSGIDIVEAEADSRVSLLETAPVENEGVDLANAAKVVCIGLGMDKEEDMSLAGNLAAVLRADIGCTRGIAEERHWLPADRYIGISGTTIKAHLYISMGVSGQVQHVVGIRDAKIIVAVDRNEKAPIFKAADYGIVGDMYEIVPLLTEALNG